MARKSNISIAKDDKVKALTHIDAAGNARMVDVGAKDVTQRIAVASGVVSMAPATLKLVEQKAAKKGDVLAVAQLAGIMAAKRTSELIPLCHPLGLDSVQVELKPDRKLPGIRITATCKISGRTGVEMEALTAVSVAALTVYDMLKAVDRVMVISAIQVEHKSGGKSGTYERKL
jgi:cyclic pyranopterin phosphate synthase